MGISLQPTLAAATPAAPATPGAGSNNAAAGEGQAFKDVYAGKMAGQHHGENSHASTGKAADAHDAKAAAAGQGEAAATAGAQTAAVVDPALLLQLAGSRAAAKDDGKALATGHADDEDASPADLLAGDSANLADPLLADAANSGKTSRGDKDAGKDEADLLANSDLAGQMAQLLQQAASHPRHQEAANSDAEGELNGLALGRGRQLAAAAAEETANLAAASGESAGKAAPTSGFQELLANATTLPKQTAAVVHEQIASPLSHSRWNQDFGDKVVWLARNEVQSAQLDINPPHLGPMQISLQVNGDQVSASFISPHAEVRQAIEDALPKLRDMLSSAGIALGDANVGSQWQHRQQAAGDQQFSNTTRFSGEPAILPENIGSSGISSIAQPLQRGRGLVDLFA